MLRIIPSCLFNWKFSENALICSNVPKSFQFFCLPRIYVNPEISLSVSQYFLSFLMGYEFFHMFNAAYLRIKSYELYNLIMYCIVR